MRTAVKLVTLMGNTLVPMAARIQATQPANLIAYWKLGETSGTTADDSSATGADGVYSGTYTLNQTGIGDYSRSTLFAGGRVSLAANIATLDTPFDPLAGTIFCWAKISAVGVWTDGTSRIIFELGADANNRVFIYKNSVSNNLSLQYIASGAAKTPQQSTSTTNWFSCAMTWDKTADQVIGYFNGVQVGSVLNGLSSWTGSLASGLSAIADYTSAGSANNWTGNLAHVAAWEVALTAAEIASISIL